MQLQNDIEVQNLFRSMCEDDFGIKSARLNRTAFKEFLQKRYSKIIGERILIYLESEGY